MILSSVTENEIINETQKTEKKPKLNTNYFDVREEEAVKAYLIAETKQEKDFSWFIILDLCENDV